MAGRALPAYLCVIGQYSGVLPEAPLSMRLLVEMQFPTSTELLTAAANIAKDLRFTEYYTDLLNPEWSGFRSRFRSLIQQNRDFREIRLMHSPHAEDFLFGLDVLRRWSKARVLEVPNRSIIRHQVQNLTAEDLMQEKLETKYDAINGLRYVAMPFDQPLKQRLSLEAVDQVNANLGWT